MMGGIGIVERLMVPEVRGILRSPCWGNRTRLLKPGRFGVLDWRAPVHDARGPEL
jgi:hypothetical protein